MKPTEKPRQNFVTPPKAAEQAEKKDKKKKNKGVKPQPEEKNQKKPESKSLAIPMKAKDKKNAKHAAGSSVDKLKDSLKASRFRFLNECMYTSKSAEAVQMFKEDPEAFSVYHEGYRQQVTQWPVNPLDRIIKAVRKM